MNNDVIETSQTTPVLVDFWAPWCGPCRMLGPVLESLAGQANGRWKLVKINVDQQGELAQKYRVMGIPAVKLFYKGQVISEFTGYHPEPALKQWLEQELGKAGG